MVSSPRILSYENIVIEFAIDLLEFYGKHELLKNSSLDEDIEKLRQEKDMKLCFIL